VPRERTTGVIRSFSRSINCWSRAGLAASDVIVFARTTSIARTTASSAIGGPAPTNAPRWNNASSRAAMRFWVSGAVGSPANHRIRRPAPAPRLKPSTGTPSRAASSSSP
jgi:hypothetical protein